MSKSGLPLLITHHSSLITFLLRRRARIVAAEFRRVALGERVDDLVMKVVVARRHGLGDALVVHLARAVYVLAQSVIDVAFETALPHLLLVVEFDLRDQQASEAARVVVLLSLFVAADFDGQIRRVG